MTPLLVKVGVGAAAVAAGTGFALAGSSSPAVAYSSPPVFLDISIGSPAQLVARGAAVQVPVTTSCTTPDHTAYAYVSITERVGGKKTANGTTSFEVSCIGSRQTNLITVSSDNGVAFAKGTAYAAADIYSYGGSEDASATITIQS